MTYQRQDNNRVIVGVMQTVSINACLRQGLSAEGDAASQTECVGNMLLHTFTNGDTEDTVALMGGLEDPLVRSGS